MTGRLTPRQRRRIESEVEALIALLDVNDGDCDLEPEKDRCPACDDAPVAHWGQHSSFDDEDAEPTEEPRFGVMG